MLEAGAPAPSFRLPSTAGKPVSSSSLKGTKYVLYFYPKDDTPGCTREACDFRDNLGRLRREGVAVFGVSKDSLASHERFREKHRLPFVLLSDEDSSVAKAYGAFGEKNLYGKKTMGTIRSTYLVDEKGKIEGVWSKVKVDGHVDEVLARVRGDSGPAKKRPAKKK